MKKLLLYVLPIFCIGIFSQSYAQCTPNATPCTNGAAVEVFGGLCDTLVPDGLVNTPYDENIQFYINGECFDAQAVLGINTFGFDIRIDAINSVAFGGLPTGVNAGTDQPSYTIAENATVLGCGFFNGTPTDAGVFDVVVDIAGHGVTCGFVSIGQDANIPFNIEYTVLPDASYSGLPASMCITDAAVTLTATGTTGGTFSGPGVTGSTFDPAVAGLGVHDIVYTVSAQDGAAVEPATNTETKQITITSSNTYYADTDNDGYGDPSGTTMTSCSTPAGFVLDNTDCDDTNAAINPGAAEICDGLDNDCAAGVDDGLPSNTFYADTDNDGYGDAAASLDTCLVAAPAGYVTDNTDCDDTNGNVHPNAAEPCDGIDNNCVGGIDEGGLNTYYADTDNDNYGDPNGATMMACNPPAGFVLDNTDCDDTNPAINPGATEIGGNGTDEDCDGFDAVVDLDGDNFTNDVDCDDNNNTVYPGAPELCDGLDNDCNNQIDEGLTTNTYYLDLDNDGYGDAAISIDVCNATAPAGYTADNTDCNDNNSTINPGAPEVCNNADENCNNQIDEGLTEYTFYFDGDNDGYGDAAISVMQCDFNAPAGYVSNDDDCDDTDSNLNPDQAEICDGIDNDCNGFVDDGLPSFTYYIDADTDGYGDAANALTTCEPIPAGYVMDNTDCDDTNADINPGMAEVCNGLDDDCDGIPDDNLVFTDYYVDADGDGFGAEGSAATNSCDATMAGFADNDNDCDDTDADINPAATDLAKDCNPFTVSIRDLEDNIEVLVFPNPTNDILNIEIYENIALNFEVIDMNGRILSTDIVQTNKGYQINMAPLNAGIYLVRMTTEDGGHAVKRVMKAN
ncbi:MAG: MopE-related protein [Chitinophagales bacterium]